MKCARACRKHRSFRGCRLIARAWLAVGVVLHASAVCVAQTLFVPLGSLNGQSESIALAVSGNGTAVVGYSGATAFCWRPKTGMIPLGHLPSPYDGESVGLGVSRDGNVVVGYDTDFSSKGFPKLPFRWDEITGIEPLLPLSAGGIDGSVAYGTSGDGAVIVGYREGVGGFRWTRASGPVLLFPSCFEVTAITPDASVIVGTAPFAFFTAFRWSQQAGPVNLGSLPGGTRSSAFAVSADGLTVVGGAHSPRTGGFSRNEAFRWTAATGMAALGDLAGGSFESEARAVSADGSIVIGWGTTPAGREGFVWTSNDGMRNFRDVLTDQYGLADELMGWSGIVCTGISEDGTVVVGSGLNPGQLAEAWLVILDFPLNTPRCSADFDRNGRVDSQDLFHYLMAFLTTHCCHTNPEVICDTPANFNRDHCVNSADFFDFLAAFFAGC